VGMPKELSGINTDIEKALAVFRPVLQELNMRDSSLIGTPVLLASPLFPNLRKAKNIRKWILVILKTNLHDGSRAKFLSQYDKSTGIMKSYIIIDQILYVETKVPHITRKLVVVHEFCHFLSQVYACLSVSDNVFQEILKNRLSKIVDVLTNEQAFKLYQLVNKYKQIGKNIASLEETKDDHFRLYCEDLELSYTDLFKNFLLSRELFDEYFNNNDRQSFFILLRSGRTQEALDLYISIATRIAEEKWLAEEFAVNQAIDILMDFYINEI